MVKAVSQRISPQNQLMADNRLINELNELKRIELPPEEGWKQ